MTTIFVVLSIHNYQRPQSVYGQAEGMDIQWIVEKFSKRKKSRSIQILPEDSEAKTAPYSFGTMGFFSGVERQEYSLLCVARKTAVSISSAIYQERFNHPAISQERKLSLPCSESATSYWRGNFLYAEPAPVIPHSVSSLTLSQNLFKSHF
jgi:hypothetical protein